MHELIADIRYLMQNGSIYGTFCKTSDPMVIEALGNSGLHYVILDLEHGPNDLRTLGNLIRAAHISGLLPIVRVPGADPNIIGQVLDLGAGGVQVPNISDVATARQCIQAARFAPLGQRGVCRFVRAANYGQMDRQQYFQQSNEALLILQVEGSAGIAQLDDILALDGFDVLFLGPYDLSQSLGLPGQIDHPDVRAAITNVVRRCAERGRTTGIFADNPAGAESWRKCGVRYLATGVDLGIFAQAAKAWGQSLGMMKSMPLPAASAHPAA